MSRIAPLCLSVVPALLALGCSASTGSGASPDSMTQPSMNTGGTTAGRGGASTGASTSSTTSTTGSNQNAGTGATFSGILQNPTGSGGNGGAGGACAQLTLAPETISVDQMIPVDIKCNAAVPEPIAIYIVLDNSGSMADNNKWPDAVDAITMFVQSDPSAMGSPWTCVDMDGKSVAPPASLAAPGNGAVSVALQYFNVGGRRGGTGGTGANLCDGSVQRMPAVPMGPLPANGPAIVSSLNANGPNGNTPTVGALTGGTQFCTAYQAANPDKKCVVVLVTDGQPNGCGLSSTCGGFGGNNDCVDPTASSVLVPIAQSAFMTNGVLTFTMGMNGVTADGFNLLNQIAAAGGSDCTPGTPGNETCDITMSGAQGFLAALNTIRKTVQVTNNSSMTITTTMTQSTTLQCEWGIPQPPAGQTFDKTLVNVSYAIGGANPTTVGNVGSKGDCAAAHDGWYYDDPNTPKRISVCPETCTTIQASKDAKVNVLVGCATVPATVR